MADPTLPENDPLQPTATGASVTPVYTRRDMTMYALTETEITTISSINTSVSLELAISSFLLSSSLGVYTNAVFYTELTPSGQLAKSYAAPLVALLGITYLFRAIVGIRKRGKLWKNLKNESKNS